MNAKIREVINREVREAEASLIILQQLHAEGMIDKQHYENRKQIYTTTISTARRILSAYTGFEDFEVNRVSSTEISS